MPKTNCPECNSLQTFAPKANVENGIRETYILCYRCGYKKVLDSYPEHLHKEKMKALRDRNYKIRHSVS